MQDIRILRNYRIDEVNFAAGQIVHNPTKKLIALAEAKSGEMTGELICEFIDRDKTIEEIGGDEEGVGSSVAERSKIVTKQKFKGKGQKSKK